MLNKQSFITVGSERRIMRLLSLFEPYRFLKVTVTEELDGPLTLSPSGKYQTRPYTVTIWKRLLGEQSPDWLEYALLSYARNFVYHFERRSAAPQVEATQTQSYRQLIEFWRTIPPVARTTIVAADTLSDVWSNLQQRYFPERSDLLSYRVRWSNRRQRTCLASCNVEKQTVNIAKLFEQQEFQRFIAPLLYHEMCHAALGRPLERGGRRVLHGREFKALERRNPDIAVLNSWIKSGGWHQAARRWRRAQSVKRRTSQLPQR